MRVLQGVRVLELAQFIFVPAAGVILSEWGADVIKIEHPVRGDAQRGLARVGGVVINADRNPILEHANRGKRRSPAEHHRQRKADRDLHDRRKVLVEQPVLQP